MKSSNYIIYNVIIICIICVPIHCIGKSSKTLVILGTYRVTSVGGYYFGPFRHFAISRAASATASVFGTR